MTLKKLMIGSASPVPDGQAYVQFDAGGQSTSVTPNPVRPVLEEHEGKKCLVLRWTLAEPPLHANPEFEVIFGNVVPCHKKDAYLGGLVSRPESDDKHWIWRWPVPDPQLPPGEEVIRLYDLFFIYQPKQSAGGPNRPGNAQTVSLRQILSADPTLILPPKPGKI